MKIHIDRGKEHLERIQAIVEKEGFTVVTRERNKNEIILDIKENLDANQINTINAKILESENTIVKVHETSTDTN